MKKLITVFIFLGTFVCTSQRGGEAVYSFLNLPTSARQMALGGATLTLEGDVNQPLWNPATIDTVMNQKMAVNYTSYLAGISLGSFSYATKVNEKLGMFHGGITYLDYGSLTRADVDGNITGQFKAYDLALSVGYAYAIKNISLGANVKLINSLIDTFSSLGVAMDFSVLYKNPNTPFRASLVFRNVGKQLKTFNGTNEKLPLQIAFGISSQLEHVPIKWFATIDNLQQWNISTANPSNATINIDTDEAIPETISFFDNAIRHAVFGVELWPDNKFTVRLGYNYRRAKELSIIDTRTLGGLSYGFGLKLKALRFNYALTKFHPSTDSSTFSLIVDLD